MLVSLGGRQLHQQQEHAVGGVGIVDARVFFKRPHVLRQPERFDQLVPEDLEVNLPGPGELFVRDVFGQLGERLAVVIHPSGPGLGREVVQAVVETMIAQARGIRRPQAKRRFQVLLEAGRQQRVGILAKARHAGGRRKPHSDWNHQSSHRSRPPWVKNRWPSV